MADTAASKAARTWAESSLMAATLPVSALKSM
jgi:hypothetical protein